MRRKQSCLVAPKRLPSDLESTVRTIEQEDRNYLALTALLSCRPDVIRGQGELRKEFIIRGLQILAEGPMSSDIDDYRVTDSLFWSIVDDLTNGQMLSDIFPSIPGWVDKIICRASTLHVEYLNQVVSSSNRGKLIQAVYANNAEQLDALAARFSHLLHGKTYGGLSLMHAAATCGAEKSAAKLIELKSPLQEYDRRGYTPLHIAARQGHADVLSLLIQAGADVDKRRLEHSEYTKGDWLRKTSMGTEEIDKEDKTALHIAVEAGHHDIVSLLLSSGADPNAEDMSKATPLYLGLTLPTEKQCSMIDTLLSAGATWKSGNRVNDLKSSCLHVSVSNCSPEVVRRFLEAGANPDERGDDGWTPLQIAVRKNKVKMVALLLAFGADPALVGAHGKTAVDLALVNKRFEVLSLLQENVDA